MGLFVCLHKQLGAISRLRYLSESETFIIPSCQRTYFPPNPPATNGSGRRLRMQPHASSIGNVLWCYTSLHFTYSKASVSVTFDKYCCLKQ